MSNGELILHTSEDGAATCKQFSRVGGGIWKSVVAQNATTGSDWFGDALGTGEVSILRNAGSVSAAQAERIAFERYEAFDAKRKEAERIAAGEQSDILELERIAETTKRKQKGIGK